MAGDEAATAQKFVSAQIAQQEKLNAARARDSSGIKELSQAQTALKRLTQAQRNYITAVKNGAQASQSYWKQAAQSASSEIRSIENKIGSLMAFYAGGKNLANLNAVTIGALPLAGGTMTGNLTIQGSLYPSMYLQPNYNGTTNRTVFEGSYAGASSFAAWEDNTGNNRRMLEVRTAAYAPSMDNAVLLRTAVNGAYYSYRVFHSGMATPVPVYNGGTGSSYVKGALNNLGVFYSSYLPASGVDGQICLVPVS